MQEINNMMVHANMHPQVPRPGHLLITAISRCTPIGTEIRRPQPQHL